MRKDEVLNHLARIRQQAQNIKDDNDGRAGFPTRRSCDTIIESVVELEKLVSER